MIIFRSRSQTIPVRFIRTLCAVLLALCVLSQETLGQGLTFALLDRYLGSLREQAAIPGLSVAVVQDGRVVWERGFGFADVDAAIAATPDTPYPIGDLSQTVGATLFLQRCIESGEVLLDDWVVRWAPAFPERGTTFRQLLGHSSSIAPYTYDPARFEALTRAVEECADREYANLLAADILDRLGMATSVPGSDVAVQDSAARSRFDAAARARYDAVLDRMALPYRIEGRRAVGSTYPPTPATAARGLVTTVRDLARFDSGLADGVLLREETLSAAFTKSPSSPMGLGWFVQPYDGETVVWHFGLVPGAYSSLMIKVPARGLTFIGLANSDGLSAPFPFADGDVTVSPFTRVFLRLLG